MFYVFYKKKSVGMRGNKKRVDNVVNPLLKALSGIIDSVYLILMYLQ